MKNYGNIERVKETSVVYSVRLLISNNSLRPLLCDLIDQ
jgi:hypothetical protein